MIPVARVGEPKSFDAACRKKGAAWLKANPDAKRPKDLWSPFKLALSDGFGGLCGYSAMHSPVGTVDHFASWANNKPLAYEWDNFRFAEAWINSSKRTLDDEALDPFDVKDGWFEVTLPSLQLVMTDKVPKKYRKRAETMLTRLHLRDDERVVRQRRKWLEMYEEHKLTLAGLQEVAPLLARAVAKARR
jgi:hypothetical protein